MKALDACPAIKKEVHQKTKRKTRELTKKSHAGAFELGGGGEGGGSGLNFQCQCAPGMFMDRESPAHRAAAAGGRDVVASRRARKQLPQRGAGRPPVDAGLGHRGVEEDQRWRPTTHTRVAELGVSARPQQPCRDHEQGLRCRRAARLAPVVGVTLGLVVADGSIAERVEGGRHGAHASHHPAPAPAHAPDAR